MNELLLRYHEGCEYEEFDEDGDTAQLEGNVVSAWELPSSNHLLLIELRGPLNLTL